MSKLEDRQKDIRERLKEAIDYWMDEDSVTDEMVLPLAITEVLCLGLDGIIQKSLPFMEEREHERKS